METVATDIDRELESLKRGLESRFEITEFKLLHTAIILREGWEMDNRGWIIESGGEILAFTTSHGGLYEWHIEDMRKQLELTNKSKASIEKAISLMLPTPPPPAG